MVDNAPAAIIATDLAGVIRFCNRQAEILYGRPAAELLGHESDSFAIDAVDENLRSEIGHALIAGESWEGIFRIRRADGTVAVVQTTDGGILDASGQLVGVACVSVDVTERSVTEEALRSSEARKGAVLAAALDAIVSVDAGGLILEFNPAAEAVFGYQREEVMGRSMPELLIPPSLRDVHRRGFAAYLETNEARIIGRRIEMRAMRRDESEFPAELAIARIDLPGRPQFTAYIRDITERRQAERAVVESRQRFAHLAETLQRSLLPPVLPAVPGLDVAARYRPAGEGTEVGGDFYDLFETAKDDWHLVVGDVQGKGAEAAAVTALARYTVRAAAIRSRKPSVILTVLNEALLRQEDERFCTVAYARLRPRHHGGIRMAVASGGHPLPLRVRRSGAVDTVGQTGPLIGVLDTVQFFDVRLDLAPGELVIFYTDGVTEARCGSEQFGEARLCDLLRNQVGADSERVVADVEDAVLAFQGGHTADDFCVIALRVTGTVPAIE